MARKSSRISRKLRKKLEAARVARMATLNARRRPHMVPICFTYDGTFSISAIDRKPKRVAQIGWRGYGISGKRPKSRCWWTNTMKTGKNSGTCSSRKRKTRVGSRGTSPVVQR